MIEHRLGMSGEACGCGRPDCTATGPQPAWHRPTLGVNEYGTPVSIHVCTSCGHEFTVCPANLDNHGDGCLGETCPSYDISRDVDIFFEPAAEAGWIRKGRA
jgi:hypothetical protein